MRKTIVFFTLLWMSTSIEAQTIMLGPITKLNYCVGDTLIVPYQASGSFNSDNFFTLQLSDTNGSFQQFRNVDQSTLVIGNFKYILTTSGNHFRVRAISSAPYEQSADNGTDITVHALPNPSIAIKNRSNPFTRRYTGVGLSGDELFFSDTSVEPAGSSYLWKFSGHPIILDSTSAFVNVIYDTNGSQSATVLVANPNGCTRAYTITYYIGSCDPIIPKTATVVTGTDNTGDYHYAYWVKSGGTLNVTGAGCPTIYAEPGSVINNQDQGGCEVYYLRSGALFTGPVPFEYSTFILPSGAAFTYNPNLVRIDTLHCDNLTFDYSQVNASVTSQEAHGISIRQSEDAMYVKSDGEFNIQILNLLGAEALSKRGTGTLDLDLSTLPTGIYFAIVQAGDTREVKRIAVIH